MKKFLLINLIVIIIFCMFPFVGFAETAGVVDAPETVETQNNIVDKDSQKFQIFRDIFTRTWEFCLENKKEVITVFGDGALLVFGLFVKKRWSKHTKDIENDLEQVKNDTSGTFKLHSKVVGGFNEMVDGYKGMQNEYKKNQTVEEDRNRLIGAVMVQNTAILEMLSTVYVNNKNLPQGVKDLITLQYANCLKALDDDELLRAIVDAVREKIEYEELTDPEETEQDNTVSEV